jgi:phosphoserine phosphatase RsbU/P
MTHQRSAPDQKLGRTIRDDVFSSDTWHSLRHEFRDLKEFYLDDQMKQRLLKMGRVKRGLYITGWLIKILLLRLSPIRRVLLLLGMLLILFSGSIQWQSGSFRTTPDTYIFGGILIVLVLMLELKDKLLARSELEAGRSVQYALMPPKKPEIPGWSAWIHSEPANEVGGDLIDYLQINGDRHGLAIGDIAGKGLRAALLMAKLQATIRALRPEYAALNELMEQVNSIFYRDSVRSIFASLIYIELMPDSGSIRCVNAGHLPPFVISGESVSSTEKSGPALGMMDATQYSECSVNLQPGDLFVAYSDGITEARNELGEFFGDDRFIKLIRQSAHYTPEYIGERIIREIRGFRGDARAYDDISMILLKYK